MTEPRNRTPRRGPRTLLVCFALILLPALAPAGSPAIPGPNPRRTPVVEVVEKVRPAVVNIHSERTVRGPSLDPFNTAAPTQNRVNGMGTGIIIDPRGYIVTNQHVVEDVQLIRARLADGTSYSARVVARDLENDLAILKIDAPHPLTAVQLGTSSDLMVGEPVIAIGNAYGYEHTLTTGVVSAVKRDVSLNKEIQYKQLIQTDASINPGNSGGPLLNVYGELIGVNVAIRAGAQNIGFAIPVDLMIKYASDVLGLKKRLGVSLGMSCNDAVDVSSNPVVRTLVVDRVEPGSLASAAGMKPGDVVVKADDVKVGCSLDMERGFLEKVPGEKIALVVHRGSEDVTLDMTLPAPPQRVVSATPAVNTGGDVVWRKLGIRLAPVALDTVKAANPQLRGGLLIEEVDPNGVAGQAGLQRGDVLVGLHQFETLNADNVQWVLTHRDLASFQPLRFFVIRNGQVRKGLLPQIN